MSDSEYSEGNKMRRRQIIKMRLTILLITIIGEMMKNVLGNI